MRRVGGPHFEDDVHWQSPTLTKRHAALLLLLVVGLAVTWPVWRPVQWVWEQLGGEE